MTNANEVLAYQPISEGRSLPLQATEAKDIPLPSILHPIERIRQIQLYVGEFVTHGALKEHRRAYTRTQLIHLATINAFDTATHNFDVSTEWFNQSTETFNRATELFNQATATFEKLSK